MTDKCPACGTPWTDHLGIQGTCYKLQTAIRTLAACSVTGLGRDVVKVCDEVLKDLGEV